MGVENTERLRGKALRQLKSETKEDMRVRARSRWLVVEELFARCLLGGTTHHFLQEHYRLKSTTINIPMTTSNGRRV